MDFGSIKGKAKNSLTLLDPRESLSAANPKLSFAALEEMLSAFASAFTQENRLIRLQIGDGKTFDERLLPQLLDGRETLSASYRYDLICLSPDAFIPLERLIGQVAQIGILAGGGGIAGLDVGEPQWITRCGIITEARGLSSDGGFGRYKFIIESPLALLRYRTASRVFQDVTVPEIVARILQEHIDANPSIGGILRLELNLRKQYPARSYCLQYRETDLAFIERLLFEEGIGYTHAHEAGDVGSIRFIAFDDPWDLPQASQGTIRFHRAEATEKEDSLTEWTHMRRLGPSEASLTSYNYKEARTDSAYAQCRAWLEETFGEDGEVSPCAESSLEDFDAQTLYYGTDSNELTRYAELRQQAHERKKSGYQGQGNVRALLAGQWFQLTEHPLCSKRSREECEFVVCELLLSARNNLEQKLASTLSPLPSFGPPSGGQETSPPPYWIKISARKRGLPLTPAYAHTRHARPTAMGLQSATVTGPQGEEVYTDEMGRVKIQFHWQRPREHLEFGADFDERSSCWVRVAYPGAGAAWGHQSIPRIGQEVLVGFLDDDIDRPIIKGVIHNGRQPNPWFSGAGSLPANRALTGIQTKEHHGQQYGELLFDDTTEQVRVKLSSEHGKTQLNQGYLIHPRKDGEGEPRGEGFELRTDLSGAIRAAKGILISAHERGMAAGNQLDREELIVQLEMALEIAKELAKDSEANEAETTNTDPQKRLTDYVKAWEDGSNVGKKDNAEGKSIAALTAPEGVALATEANILVASGASQDFVTSQDANHTVGQKLRMRVGDAFSLFTRQTMKVISALGKIRIAALSDEIELSAKKKLHLISLEEIVMEAPKITLRAQDAGVEYGGGITNKTSGAFLIYASSQNMTSPASVSPEGALGASQMDYDQKLKLTWHGGGAPIKNRAYRLLVEDGREFTGTTDAEGHAEQLQSELGFAQYKVELLPPTA